MLDSRAFYRLIDEMWHFAHELDWIEGTPGKGMLYPGEDGELELITWTTGEDQGPTHLQYCAHHGLDFKKAPVVFDIQPDGGIWSFLKDEVGPKARQFIQQADPRLNAEAAVGEDQWILGSKPRHVLDWDEGNEGLGALTSTGVVHTWNEDDYRTHKEWQADHPDQVVTLEFRILPNGRVDGAPRNHKLLRSADPRLHVNG